MWMKVTIPLAVLVLCVIGAEAQTRRLRIKAKPVQQVESSEEEASQEAVQPVVQYYRSQPKQDNAQELVYVNEEEYQNLYGQSTPPARREYRPSPTTVRPLQRAQPTQSLAPRTKEPEAKAPPVQTLRNYNKVNDDGSFTFGYEAADGSFKEETRGTDCVVRGRYGYVDPEGNKREFTYVSGNPCDPNNPDGSEEEERNNQSIEDADENVPQNYPKRPAAAARPRPTASPTTRAPTTVFQNRYNHQSLASEEEEDPNVVQYAQIPKAAPRPAFVQSTPRPRVQTPPPATTYRPNTVSVVTQKPVHVTTPSYSSPSVTFSGGSQRGAIDFDSEFKKFQQETGFQPITPSSAATQSTKSVKQQQPGQSNPIYQNQLVFNPSSGQYDSNLYQSIAQTDGEFQLNQRIQPYVSTYQQQQYQQPQYQQPQYQAYRPQPVAQAQVQAQAQPQVPQQVYQKQQNDLQFVNSQQLFAQQLQMQQSQLHRDRIEAAKKGPSPVHRYQLQQQSEPSPSVQHRPQQPQQFYYIQPSSQQSSGQIEAFLRGHNLEY